MGLEGGNESAVLFAGCAYSEDLFLRHNSGEAEFFKIIVDRQRNVVLHPETSRTRLQKPEYGFRP